MEDAVVAFNVVTLVSYDLNMEEPTASNIN